MLLNKKKEDNTEGLFNTSIIAKSLKLTGDLDSEKNIRVDGKIEGNVHCRAKVIIGKGGIVNGTIVTQDAEISGTVNGKITTFGCLEVKNGANIQGEIFTNNVVTEQGANINGTFNMIKNQNPNPDFTPVVEEIRKEEI